MQLTPKPKRAKKLKNKRLNDTASKHLQKSLVAAAVASILAVPSVVWAQSAESTLQGRAQPGATITARNNATGTVRRTTASADGHYTLGGLEAGTYRVDAGPGTEQDIAIGVASSVGFDFVDSAARKAELEEVVVTGRVREVRTSEVGTEVPLQQIEVTPQITRNFLEFADTVPGMIFSVDSAGRTSIRGGAQVDASVNVYIDGVGMKDYVAGGGIAGQSGSQKNGDPGNPFPQLAIQEYKVITSNYKAEFDQVASSVITAQTKSGTNEFTGEAFGDFTNQNLRAETPAEAGAGMKQGGSSTEYGFAQGGPLIKDVLHFFVTYEHKDLTLPNVVFPPGTNGATLQNLQGVLPPNVFSQFGPTSNPFKEDLVFAKLDWEPSANDRFELTDLTRLETSITGAQNQTATSAAFSFTNNNERAALLWQHSMDNGLNELRVTYEDALSTPEQSSGNPAIDYTYIQDNIVTPVAIQINGQDPRSYFRYEQRGYALQDDFTLDNLNWLGDHTLKIGYKYKSVELTARDAGQGAVFSYSVTPDGTAATPYQAVFSLTNPGQSPTSTSDDSQIGLYLQDTWVPTQRLTLDVGLRWDYETVPSFQYFQLPDSIVNAINGPFPGAPNETYAQALALGGINVNDYIGNGNNRHPQTDEYQPRLGFSFDLSGDNRHVLFGGYARSYDRNSFDVMSLERTKLAISEPTISFYDGGFSNHGCLTPADASSTCVGFNSSYLTNLPALQALATGTLGSIGEVDLVNNNLRDPYSDQFSLGIRDRIGEWNTSVTLAQINSYDGIVGHLGNRYSNGAYYQNGTQWGSQGVPGIGGNLVLFDNGYKDRNTELLVSAEKPYTKESGWSATIAYTYSHALQNNQGSYQSNNGYAFDLPFPADYPLLPSSTIPRHRLVMTASVDGPFGLLFAAKVSLATPIPVSAIEGCSDASLCHGFNAYPVVGYVHTSLQEKVVDLQLTKDWTFGHDFSAYFRFDVLNVFNTSFFDGGAANFGPSTKSFMPPVYNTTGPILGVPRELKLTGGVKW